MTHERDRLIIRVFADCGLRLDELTRLTAGDLIQAGRKAHLRVHGKRDRIRDVPVPPTLLRRLERLIARRPEERSSDAIFLTHRRGRLGEYDALSKEGVYQVVVMSQDIVDTCLTTSLTTLGFGPLLVPSGW